MPTAFGQPRPPRGRGVERGPSIEDILATSPEERRMMQEDIERNYLRKVLDVHDALAVAKRFSADAAQAERRRAAPLPFGGGATDEGGTIGGSPIRVDRGGARVPVEGVWQYAAQPSPGREGYDPTLTEAAFEDPNVKANLNAVINKYLRGSYGSGLLSLGGDEGFGPEMTQIPPGQRGIGIGVGRATAEPGARQGLPLEDRQLRGDFPDITRPHQVAAMPTPAKPAAKPLFERFRAFMQSDAGRAIAYGLAGLSDAALENLTLKGQRGAKGTAVERLIRMDETRAKQAQEDRKLEIEAQKLARQGTLDQIKGTHDIFASIGKFRSEFPTATESERYAFARIAADQAAQLGVPFTAEFIASSLENRDLADLFGDNAPFFKSRRAALSIPTLQTLMREGKYKEAAELAQSVANDAILADPEFLPLLQRGAATVRQIKGLAPTAEVPFNDLRAYMESASPEKGRAFVRLISGLNVAEPLRKAINAELARAGVEMPEAEGEIAVAVKKQEKLLPGRVKEAEQVALAEEPSKARVSAVTGSIAAGIQIEKETHMPLGREAANWEDAAGNRPLPTDSMETAQSKGFRPKGPISAGDARRSTLTLLDQIDALVPKLEAKGFLSGSYNFVAVGTAKFNRAIYPGDPDLAAFLAHAGTMVSVQRQLGDIGPRALAAFESAINIIEHPTSGDAVKAAIGQLREAILAGQPGQGGGAPAGWKIERLK